MVETKISEVEMTRNELYQCFGPLLIEAIVLTMKDELNLVRAELELPERTDEQILDAVSVKLESLLDYSWM